MYPYLVRLALVAGLLPAMAQAQNQPLFATGTLTPGHALVLQQTGTPGSAVTRDAGPAIAGNFTEIGITNDGLPLCVRDKAQQHLLCLGANALGGGLLSYNPIGNGAPNTLNINLNGQNYPFPPTGNGNVTGPTPTTIGQAAFWANTTGTLLSNSSNGQVTIGADQFSGAFGTVSLLAGNSTGVNTILGEVNNAAAPNSALLPAGVNGAGKVTSNGNTAFGLYGLSECRQTLGGVCIGAEMTARNFTNNNPDINLPPNTSFGTPTTVVTGQNITCGSGGGETKDCSIGINLGSETGLYSGPAFNAGIYLGLFRQYGLYIDAMPSGNQTSAVLRNNGTGINLQLITTGNIAAGNAVISMLDKNAVSHFTVDQSGDTSLNTLQYAGHGAAPTLGACGTGSGLSVFSTDAHGIIIVGSGTTTCVVNFGTAFTQVPVVVVTGENGSTGLSVLTKGATSFTITGTSGFAGNNVDYVVMSQGSL